MKNKPRTTRKVKTAKPIQPAPSIWQQYASVSILILEGKLTHDIGLAFLSIILALDTYPNDGPNVEALLNIPDIAANTTPAARKEAIEQFRKVEAGQ